MGRAVRQAD